MNRKPHALSIGCSYTMSENKTKKILAKKTLGESKLEGHIILEDGKNKIRLPMRSFVQNFMTKLHGIFTGDDTASNMITTASIADGASTQRKAGILLGNGETTPTITRTDFAALVSSVSYGCDYKGHTFLAPYAPTETELRTRITRLITNASSANWSIREVGLKTHKASTATAASTINNLMTHDGVAETFSAASDKLVSLDFSVIRNSSNGGAVLNLLRVFYNLYLQGSANYSAFLPRSGTGSYTYASALASGPFVVDAIAVRYWGIVVGRYDDGVNINGLSNPIVGPDDHGEYFGENTELTYGANTISPVTQSGNKVYFTISRDITNGTTAAILITRMGLLTKGATADPTTLQNDQIYVMVNRSATIISIAPNQTIRIEYKFEINA